MTPTSLRLQPETLPKSESFSLAPQFRGVSGAVTFSLNQNEDEIALKVQAKLGMLLFKNAFNFEVKSDWNKADQDTLFLRDYQEINHKSGKVKSSAEGIRKAKQKFEGQFILDPLSILYALRAQPVREVGERRIGHGARIENPITVEMVVRSQKQTVVNPLGSSSRALLGLALEITSPKSESKIKVFDDGRTNLWIDRELNIPVEVSYEVPPIGALTLTLNDLKTP